jgi:Domain of unknown function (DUF1963)
MWLGATGSRPAVEVLLSPSGERLPLPLPIVDGSAFDHATSREGWIAFEMGTGLLAFHDGDLIRPRILLGAVWHIAPSIDPTLLLVHQRSDERSRISYIDKHGTITRSHEVKPDAGWVVGELASGEIVTSSQFIDLSGSVRSLPFDIELEASVRAVVAGRFLVLNLRSKGTWIFDTAASEDQLVPSHDAFTLSPHYNLSATRVVFEDSLSSGLLVVTENGKADWFDVSFRSCSCVWLDNSNLFIAAYRTQDGACVLNVDTGKQTAPIGVPKDACPRIDVTGRFDPQQLRDALKPAWRGPIPGVDRVRIAERENLRVREALGGLPSDVVMEECLPAVRLRSCLAPSRLPVGSSHFGGRPDLPKGHSWPLFNGEPMAFHLQVRCDELQAAMPEAQLPDDGLFVVFTALEHDGGYPPASEAVHVEIVPIDSLRRRAWPKDLMEELRFEPSLAVAEPTLTLPDWPVLEELIGEDSVGEVLGRAEFSGTDHRMFGHPRTVQGIEPHEGARLLLQIASDPIVGTTFGDGGTLIIWALHVPLILGVVDGCFVEMDCS